MKKITRIILAPSECPEDNTLDVLFAVDMTIAQQLAVFLDAVENQFGPMDTHDFVAGLLGTLAQALNAAVNDDYAQAMYEASEFDFSSPETSYTLQVYFEENK